MVDKYTQENLDEIRYILESRGDKKTAMESVPIVKSTWSTWIKEKPEFAELVSNAMSYWKRSDSDHRIHSANKIEGELLSDEGSITEIIDTVVLDKRGGEHPITTVKKERGSPWLMKKLSEAGEEEKQPTKIEVHFTEITDD